MNHILIVEDETRIASLLQKGLRAEGFATTVIAEGNEAAAAARDDAFDLVLLDVGLPGKDGFAVLRELRGRGERLPVILLTARDAVTDRVAGLNGGADDYVPKPFSFEELLARVRARLRDVAAKPSTTLTAAGVTLDLLTRTATVDGRSVELTTQECALAEVFVRQPDQVLGREELLRRVWGYTYDPGSNILEVYVGYLRRKLGRGTLLTVRGKGYRLRAGTRPVRATTTSAVDPEDRGPGRPSTRG